MDMGLGQARALFGADAADDGAAAEGRPVRPVLPFDWRALRARLAAAHAARAALSASSAAVGTGSASDGPASFDNASARALGAYADGIGPVNPNASSGVKPVGGNQGDVAGGRTASGQMTGDRGPT
ncbi:MAG TPA: hypothetical protein VF440_14820 [Novosphingobium sp.]